MKIAVISDLHGDYPDIDPCDILIVCGDLTGRDHINEYHDFEDWLQAQCAEYKLFIGGNHDNQLQARTVQIRGAINLIDQSITIKGYKFYGFPWTPRFAYQNPRCTAFCPISRDHMAEKCNAIPGDVDILVSHGPPMGILDKCSHGRVGSEELLRKVKEISPKYHVFGHIHEARGAKRVFNTEFINCAHFDEVYDKTRGPVYFTLPVKAEASPESPEEENPSDLQSEDSPQ